MYIYIYIYICTYEQADSRCSYILTPLGLMELSVAHTIDLQTTSGISSGQGSDLQF